MASPYAQDYFNMPDKKQFTDHLLSLPVPVLFEPILTHLVCSIAPHTQNIIFFLSITGVHLDTHFDQFFPINMLSAIARTNTRITPQPIDAYLHSRVLFTVICAQNSVNFPATIANLLESFRSPDFQITNSNAKTDNTTAIILSFDRSLILHST
jgi:hypothetical protein